GRTPQPDLLPWGTGSGVRSGTLVARLPRNGTSRLCRHGAIHAGSPDRIFLPRRRAAQILRPRSAIAADARAGTAGPTQWMALVSVGHDRKCHFRQQFHPCRLPAVSTTMPMGLVQHAVLAEIDQMRVQGEIADPTRACGASNTGLSSRSGRTATARPRTARSGRLGFPGTQPRSTDAEGCAGQTGSLAELWPQQCVLLHRSKFSGQPMDAQAPSRGVAKVERGVPAKADNQEPSGKSSHVRPDTPPEAKPKATWKASLQQRPWLVAAGCGGYQRTRCDGQPGRRRGHRAGQTRRCDLSGPTGTGQSPSRAGTSEYRK